MKRGGPTLRARLFPPCRARSNHVPLPDRPLPLLLLPLILSVLLFAALALRFEGDTGATQEADPSNVDGWPGLESIDIGLGQAGRLPDSVQVDEEPGAGRWRVVFTLSSDREAQRVSLAGDFNGWNVEAAPMERAADGRWRAEVSLGSGAYRYKFCLDGQEWLPDPSNDEVEDDGFESCNSILRLGSLGQPDGLDLGPSVGGIRTEGLAHNSDEPLYLHRIPGGQWRARYRTLAGDVSGVLLLLEAGTVQPMERVSSPPPFQFWQVDVDSADQPARYTFGLETESLCVSDPRVHAYDPAAHSTLETPDWAKHAVWYQIFPERFRNGDVSNDPDPVRPWTSEWTEPAAWEGTDGQTFWEYYVYQRMYGGDIAGIEEQLDHLIDLGVTAIYLNPIFQAAGPHKYNATDFRHVDTGLGAGEDYEEATASEDLLEPSTWVWTPSDRLFLDFLATCKARGLRVVLDAVFNHVGVAHPAFLDVQENREASRFADWFQIRSWEPFEYVGWAGFGDLPVFAKEGERLASAAVKEHLFAVTRRWMDPNGDGDPSDGIDGWRLDVPMELPADFWEEWRALVKSINPDAFISGEIWHRADDWLSGKHFDAVMNYRFADPVVAWVGNVERKLSVSALDARLAELRLAYPDEATLALMNLVGSHDTDRVASMLLNRDRPYDRSNQIQRRDDYNSGRPHELHFQRQRLVALTQMTYVGAPMIYYGDEVGMWGADDPTNRKPMLWADLGPYDAPEQNFIMEDHHAFYREAIALRRAHEALRVGAFETLEADDDQDLWVFSRSLGDEVLLVALNASSDVVSFTPPQVDGEWLPLFGAPAEGAPSGGATDSALALSVGPIAGRVWRRSAPGC